MSSRFGGFIIASCFIGKNKPILSERRQTHWTCLITRGTDLGLVLIPSVSFFYLKDKYKYGAWINQCALLALRIIQEYVEMFEFHVRKHTSNNNVQCCVTQLKNHQCSPAPWHTAGNGLSDLPKGLVCVFKRIKKEGMISSKWREDQQNAILNSITSLFVAWSSDLLSCSLWDPDGNISAPGSFHGLVGFREHLVFTIHFQDYENVANLRTILNLRYNLTVRYNSSDKPRLDISVTDYIAYYSQEPITHTKTLFSEMSSAFRVHLHAQHQMC